MSGLESRLIQLQIPTGSELNPAIGRIDQKILLTRHGRVNDTDLNPPHTLPVIR